VTARALELGDVAAFGNQDLPSFVEVDQAALVL